MKIQYFVIPILAFVLCGSVFGQTDVSGTWQGKLAVSPNENITVEFILTKQPDGSYKAVLNSPDSGAIRNVAADSVKYNGGKLAIEVTSLSGSYTGTVGKGTITGEWKQPGGSLPLILTPYRKPEVASFKPLLGDWFGKLTVPGVTSLTIIYRFQIAKDGKLAGFMDVPDQNTRDIALGDVRFENGQVKLSVPVAAVEYSGQLSGGSIKGTFKQGGMSFDLNLTKGKYQVPGIEMPPEDMSRLLGEWGGKVKLGPDPEVDMATIIFRFEKTKDGKLAAFMDSPEQGSRGHAFTDVTFKGDDLIIKLPGTGGGYTGTLSGNAIAGTFALGTLKLDLTVTKGAKFPPPVTQIDLPADVMKKLLGRWKGAMSILSVVVRFEKSAAGKNAIFIDIPQQNVDSMIVLKAAMSDGNLVLKVAGAEITGKLEDNKINGTFKSINQSIPLVLTKE
jgi:hypothetical protein